MKHHAHSHRPRRSPRIRTDAEIRGQLERIERRRQTPGPREVVVQIPWGRQATAGQQQGMPMRPGPNYVRKSVTQSADRIRREREDAVASLAQKARAFDIVEK